MGTTTWGPATKQQDSESEVENLDDYGAEENVQGNELLVLNSQEQDFIEIPMSSIE
jgi:hypothetical protein